MPGGGKRQPIPVWRRTCPAVGGTIKETLELLPARVAATELRNYVADLAITYRGVLKNNGLAAVDLNARQVHRSLGTVNFKDMFGTVVPDMPVDFLFAMNLADGIVGTVKYPCTGDVVSLAAGASTSYEVTVVIAYSPEFGAARKSDFGDINNPMAASLLGKEAELRLSGMAVAPATDVEWVDLPVVSLVALCEQTKELLKPAPMEFRYNLLDATNDPFIDSGSPRKVEAMFALAEGIGTPSSPVILAGFNVDNAISLDMDGRSVLDGPLQDIVSGNAACRSGDAAFMPSYGAYYTPCYGGEMYTLVDPHLRSRATQEEHCTQLKLRGVGVTESRPKVFLVQRVRYLCPDSLANRWAAREGIDAKVARDVRIGGKPARQQGLTAAEAIGVQQVVGSRKER